MACSIKNKGYEVKKRKAMEEARKNAKEQKNNIDNSNIKNNKGGISVPGK